MIDLRNDVNRKEIPKNEIPNKIIHIVEKVLIFHEQQKGKGLQILSPKQMLERLAKALAWVKALKKSENLLNEISQMIYSLYQAK